MTLVATLICDPAAPALDDAALAIAREALRGPARETSLADGIAIDFAVASDEAPKTIEGRLRAALAGRRIDIVVQPERGRRKRLLLADMDSTMIGQECIDELADFAGLKEHVAAITERAMRGEIAFEPALRERVALLRGLPLSVIDETLQTRITLTPGARELVGTMRAHGAYACLVSGGFTRFTKVVAAKIGFDEDRANVLIEEHGVLAGKVQEPILGREAKLATLIDLKSTRGIADHETIVVGDGANDLAMIEQAGLGVAFHAKPAVAAAAGARIDHGDLTALLYAQGYARAEFVTKLSDKD
jgi:phosphoserine phosphatase